MSLIKLNQTHLKEEDILLLWAHLRVMDGLQYTAI